MRTALHLLREDWSAFSMLMRKSNEEGAMIRPWCNNVMSVFASMEMFVLTGSSFLHVCLLYFCSHVSMLTVLLQTQEKLTRSTPQHGICLFDKRSLAFSHTTRTKIRSLINGPFASTRLNHQQQADSSKQEPDALLTVSEVARHLRVETTTVRRWIANGILDADVLPHQGKRKCYRIQQHTLDELLLTSTKAESK
jgi:excisionase family DNA binding protein